MKRAATGVVLAGAAAAILGAAAAQADTWTPQYDFDNLDLVQSPVRTQLAWEVPTTYTNSSGDSISGDMFIRPSEGGPNAEFVADDGSIYALDKQIVGMPTEYYAPGPGNPAGALGVLHTLFGDVHLHSGLSWLVDPADYSDPITAGAALDKVNFSNVLDLGPSGTGDWTSNYGDMTPFTVPNAILAPNYGLPWWGFQDASFTNGDETLDGTVYLMSPLGKVGLYDEEFVTKDGAVYDINQWGAGFTNLYYDVDPGTSGAVDILKTPLGDWNMSWLSWLFTPPDYSDADFAATPEAMLSDIDLSGALDLGDAASHASPAAADVLGSL